jgi:ribose-phosphate pyrophosphokinase
MDLHADQVQGFFDVPVDNLYARPLLIEAMGKLGLKNPIVVAPDIGSLRLARSFAVAMHTDYGIVDKRRINAKQVELHALIGNVSGRDVVLVDDMCSTGETLKMASQACKKAGATRVFGAVTHGLMIGKAFEESAIEKMLITNTVPLPDGVQSPRVETVSVASLFAQAIESIVGDQSISSLFH